MKSIEKALKIIEKAMKSIEKALKKQPRFGHALARDMSRTTINLLKNLRCGAWTCRAPRAYGVLSQMIS